KDDANFNLDQWQKEREKNTELSVRHQETIKAMNEQKSFMLETNERLKEQFEALSAQVLKKKIREGAYSEIKVFLDAMKGTTEKLQKETNTLVSALKTSHTRGKYGEIGLRRVVEFSGMSSFCDFEEQSSVQSDNGLLRPDLIVNLPGNRKVIVDSKVPLNQYMLAFETEDEDIRKHHLKMHAKAVREHLKNLSSKAYWNQYKDAPDYVVMYLQIESSFGAALELDRTLIEDALNNRIIIATPTTLITMLRTIAFSWQQLNVAENIYQMRDAGIELYNRVNVLIQHFSSVGHNLNQATQSYNKAIGSLENRFIPQVKKLKEIGGSLMEKEISETKPIDTMIRTINNSNIE
ncbi:DNA recombination protein RmuC homolog, partial [Teleopsis dalmanni]|uniref:DNA recombination protein RmuC homolog n=1 Tax=Teleopsis dalmanni TaxID=139649 RepID=UPI0018CE584A